MGAGVITHVAFLRAMNTGRRRVTNADLVTAVEALGFGGVTTYQASGNLLISDEPAMAGPAIAERIGKGLSERLGYEVPTIVRTADEVQAIAEAAPFDGEPPRPECTPQVILLAVPPSSPAIVAAFSDADDQLDLVGSDIHWRPSAGVSTSELDVRTLEAAVGTMTVRTHGTLCRIADRLS
jgi:uncharacterized protein (DUF1697 family)